MARRTTRNKVFICNFIIMALCLLSIAAYFFIPLWKIKLSYQLTTETVGTILAEANDSTQPPDVVPETGTGDTGTENDETSISQAATDVLVIEGIELTPEDLVGEDGVTLSLSITLKTTDVLHALSGDSATTVQNILDANVDSMVDQIIEPMNKVVKNVAKAASKQALKQSVKEQVHQAYGDKTAEEVEQLLQDAEITDEYINGKVDALIEELYSPDATVQNVTYQVTETVEEVFDKLAQADPSFADKSLSTANKEEIEDLVEETLAFISSEGGDIDMEEFLAQLVLDAIQGESTAGSATNSDDQASTPIQGVSKTLGAGIAQPMAKSQTSTQEMSATEELKLEVRALLAEQIPAEAAETIALVFQIISYVLFFTFFAWLYIVIKVLAKLGSKNNAVKLKFPIVLGWIPFLVLWILPTVAFAILKSQSAKLGMGATAAAQFNALSLSFSSASIVSFIIAFSFAVFAIAYYGKLRKRMKLISQGKAFDRGLGATQYMQPAVPMSDLQFVNDYASGDVYENDYDNDNYYGS
ncbi:MAG: hypothetical protein IJ317_00600 [Clostridia bacterium]|nr:hypothetical protein [Clostridia bacterium]